MLVESAAGHAPWLLLTFTLPTKRASQRVEVWRKLRRYGAVPLGNSGYLLPNNAANQERFEWLATAIRKYTGDASVVKVQSIDNLPQAELIGRFTGARTREYRKLIQELRRMLCSPPAKRAAGRENRLRAQFREITAIDFFRSPLQQRAEELFACLELSPTSSQRAPRINRRQYTGRLWVTRPRPGIDRSASAWLIRCFIDKKARFTFATEERVPSAAVPFDMFRGGFGHRGESCTFETLQRDFRIHDRKVGVIGEIIHDADLLDEKFGRKEGFGIDEVLKGWAAQGVPDKELLARGIQLMEGLYRSL